MTAYFVVPFNSSLDDGNMEFTTAVHDDNGTAVVPAETVRMNRPNLGQYLINRSQGVRRLLVNFECQVEFTFSSNLQREDIGISLDVFRSLLPGFEFGFQVVMAPGLFDDTPTGCRLASGAVLEWFIDDALGRHISALGVLRERTTAVVKRDVDDTFGRGIDFKLVSFSQPS